MNEITTKNLFVDELDGKWTLGMTYKNGGTESIANFEEEDSWLYPEDINGEPNIIINVWFDDGGWCFDVLDLPDNWKDIVTQDKGKDGKPSIHDIMISR